MGDAGGVDTRTFAEAPTVGAVVAVTDRVNAALPIAVGAGPVG